MKKTTALWTLTMLVCLSTGAAAAGVTNHSGRSVNLTLVNRMQAPAQAAAAGPQWKSRDEYDAFNAMATEKDPNKKISLAEAFLQKYANSDFKDQAYLVEMQTYQQTNQMDKALDAGRKSLQANPDNLPALRFLSFTFPFLYKPDQADATSALSRADSDAHHGLEVLQKLQQPAGTKDADFQQAVSRDSPFLSRMRILCSRGIFHREDDHSSKNRQLTFHPCRFYTSSFHSSCNIVTHYMNIDK